VERTGALLHLIDGTQDDIVGAYKTIRAELKAYGHGLAKKPEVIALNKIDALGPELAEDQQKILSKAIRKKVHLISAVSHEGTEAVLAEMYKHIAKARAAAKEHDGYMPADVVYEDD
jgi:GTP-binding protein